MSSGLHPAEQALRVATERRQGLRDARDEAIRRELKTKTTRQVAAEFGISYQRVAIIANEGETSNGR